MMRIMKTFGAVGLTLLSLLEVLFLILLGIIILSGIDDAGDLTGILRCIWFVANGLLWALLFGIVVIVSMIRHRHWRFLAVTAILLTIRIALLWHEETRGAGAEDHLYVWFPIEAFVYFLWKYPVLKKHRILFTAFNLGLYGVQLLLVIKWLI